MSLTPFQAKNGLEVVTGNVTLDASNGYVYVGSRYNGGNNGAFLVQNGTSTNFAMGETASGKFGFGKISSLGAVITPLFTMDSVNMFLGIGTASPGAKLGLYENAQSNRQIEMYNPFAGTVTSYVGNWADGLVLSNNHYYTGSHVYSDIAKGSGEIGIYSSAANCYIGFATAAANTTPVERMRISTTGNVGIANNNPGTRLDVNGGIRTNDQLVSTVATGTAPLSVTSTTKVSNLNVEAVDGCNVNDSGTTTADLWTASKLIAYVGALKFRTF
jgi:hypothetical protein